MNSVHNIRIVSGRFSSRYVVRGFRFRDPNSPDLSRRGRARFVPMGAVSVGVEFIPPVTGVTAPTNLIQRAVEVALRFPFNVLTCLFISNIDTVQDAFVQDGWKIAAADDHNNHDYG